MHPSKAMEIRFAKPSFKYVAGQWLFLNVPEVSTFQWHPFTISSAPDDPYISVHIRQVGDFTTALGERLGCTSALADAITRSASGKNDKSGQPESEFVDVSEALNAAKNWPTLRIDGPYGAPAEDVFKHEVAVLIGTGIGVTPFASILKNIWWMQQKNKLGALRRVEFIWINRDTGSFEWFQTLIKNLEDAQTDPNFLTIRMYLTGKLSEDVTNNIIVNDAGMEFDALTDLKSRTNFGRPNFPVIFDNLRQSIESGLYLPGRESSLVTGVGVYYCGPSALAKSIKEKALAASSKHVRFSFHKEHF
jgi:NADPH oxidase